MPIHKIGDRTPTIYYGGLIRRFDKTPEKEIVCPHFWELNWAYGCRFKCSYCYLQGTFRGDKRPWSRPLNQIFEALDQFFQDWNDPQILNSGELTDSLVYPEKIIRIADYFEERRKHKLLLLTKSSNVKSLIDKPRKFTILSFSLNPDEVWRRWEHRTPPPKDRIKAGKAAFDVGYEIRIRIDPIFPIDDWHEHYSNLIFELLDNFEPERITLGTPRGLAKTLEFSKDNSWTEFFKKGGEKTGWGWKLNPLLREEIYLYLIQQLTELGFNKDKIALCKETEKMWHQLGLEANHCRCNCVW